MVVHCRMPPDALAAATAPAAAAAAAAPHTCGWHTQRRESDAANGSGARHGSHAQTADGENEEVEEKERTQHHRALGVAPCVRHLAERAAAWKQRSHTTTTFRPLLVRNDPVNVRGGPFSRFSFASSPHQKCAVWAAGQGEGRARRPNTARSRPGRLRSTGTGGGLTT